MSAKQIMTIVGARPQFVKASALSHAVAARAGELTERLVHTGQHYDYEMSASFFEQLKLPEPAHYLGVGSGSHATQTGAMLTAIEALIEAHKPDALVVFGDTNSTLAGALAAAKLHVPVAHIEAGMRSFNRAMPEEINRVVTDHLATWHFTASPDAERHLRAEGIASGIHPVGDVMYDVLTQVLPRLGTGDDLLAELGLESEAYALATVHRASNTDDPACLRAIFGAFEELGRRGLPVVAPLHPRTKKALAGIGFAPVTVIELPPMPYEKMLLLQKRAAAVLTDSGGVQKEAMWVGTPCVTLRDETEWVETVETGWNVLVGADAGRIVDRGLHHRPQGEPPTVYGDGHAAEQIVDILIQALS